MVAALRGAHGAPCEDPEPAGKQGLVTPYDPKIEYENDTWCMVVHAKWSHNTHEVGDACSTDHIWPTHGRASASEALLTLTASISSFTDDRCFGEPVWRLQCLIVKHSCKNESGQELGSQRKLSVCSCCGRHCRAGALDVIAAGAALGAGSLFVGPIPCWVVLNRPECCMYGCVGKEN